MKICNATGNGICVNCNHVPPKVNGYSYGNICRMDVEDILAALEYGNLVCYNTDNGKFYEKRMYEHPRDFVDDGDWICLEQIIINLKFMIECVFTGYMVLQFLVL